MRPHEFEIRIKQIVQIVLNGQKFEDTTVELKTNWIDATNAAPRLGAHANAARGEPITWVIGLDENNHCISTVDPTDLANWWPQVESCFDGKAPYLLISKVVEVNCQVVVGLYFDTAQDAPFVVKNPKGGYATFAVPWRAGTRLRAANRADLLRILTPIVRKPTIEVRVPKLTLKVVPPLFGGNFRHQWKFEGQFYITPADDKRVVIRYLNCEIWIIFAGAEAWFRIGAIFHPSTHNAPMLSQKRASSTITCADSELLATGPGSAVLAGLGELDWEDNTVPAVDALVRLVITPVNAEIPNVLQAIIRPNPTGRPLPLNTYEWSE